MRPLAHTGRAGMTLVELLVVVVILLVLAATVLPSIAGSAESRRSREAARIVSSFIAKSQSRSLGRQQWSGFAIVPVNTATYTAIDLFLADVPDPYRGDSTTTTLAGGPSATGTWTGTTSSAADLQTGTSIVRAGDLIRLDGRGPLYQTSSISLGSTGTISFQMRSATNSLFENVGQNTHNTPWPFPATSGSHTFEIFPRPTMSGSPLTLPDNRCIDLFHSGYGPNNTTTWTMFNTVTGAGSNVAVLFDGTGRLRQLVITSTSGAVSRTAITGPMFLLVGRIDRAGQAYSATLSSTNNSLGANWQYPDSTWIAIDPMTGSVRAAACTVSTTSALLSQDWLRRTLLSAGQ